MWSLVLLSVFGLASAQTPACGTYTIDVGETLDILSENHPSKYPSDVDCTWDVTCSTMLSNIEFDCSIFELQNSNGCAKDYLLIRDGMGLLDTACEVKDDGVTIVTNDNHLTLNFITNSDNTRKAGFSCTATCMAVTTTTTLAPTTTTTPGPLDCGSHTMEVGETVTIESDRYPLKYPADTDCTWDITCNDVNSNIEFECQSFELQNSNMCKKDYLTISDGTGQLDKSCAKNTPTGIVTSDNTLTLDFITNSDSTRKPGFSCTATCIAVTTTTPATTTTTTPPITTTTTTPTPTTTTPAVTTTTTTPTTTTTTAPITTTTTTTPTTTTTTPTTTTTTAPITTTTTTTPTTTTTTTPTTTTPPTTTPGPLECGTHTMEVGETLIIESNRHPLKYPKSHTCNWDITCTQALSVIAFDCTLFELQNSNGCKKDYLEISDASGQIEKSCAKNTPTGIVTSDNTLTLDFVTNADSTTKPGFTCTATCLAVTTTTTVTPTTSTSTTTTTPPITTTTTTPPTTTPGPLACGTHTMDVGDVVTIESDRYPLKYPADHDCTWDITCSDVNSVIEFECQSFELQNSNMCKKDYLTISDGTGQLDKSCAKDTPTGIVTSDNTLSLDFITNSDSTRKSGFSCTAACIGVTTTTPPTTTTTTTPTTTTPTTTTTTTTPTTSTSTTTTTTPATTTTTPTTSSSTTSSSTTSSTTTSPTTSSTTSSSTTSSSTTSTTTTTKGPDSTEDPAALDRLPCQCGVATAPTGDAQPHNLLDNPWTVALLDNNDDHFCSGTIINTLYILTAKNCVSSRGTSFKIRANEHELGTGLPRDITRDPTSVIYNGDLALIRMDVSISLTNYDGVKPACLPNSNKDFVGENARHSGYDHSKVLKNDGVWTTESGNRLNFDPNSDGKPYCNEDLGGPIVTEQGGKNFLAGIALDEDCSTSFQESAKVSSYYDWIYNNSNTGRFCER